MSRPEQRQNERIEARLRVHVEVGDTVAQGETINVSLGGALVDVKLQPPPRVGDRWRIAVSLPTLPEPIRAEAQVRWIGGGGECGVQFATGLRAREAFALGQWLEHNRKGTA